MYDHIAPGYNRLHGQEQRRKLERLLMNTHIKEGVMVLDVGCGTAHLADLFEKQDYLGIDPSQPLLDQAPKNIKTICSKGESLPVPDQSADIVLSLTALHNYDDWEQGIKELHRVAKDLVLVGVLKNTAVHDDIVRRLKETFVFEKALLDQHDSLLILRVK